MSSFPHNVDLDKANLRDVICYLNKPKEEDDPGSVLVSRVVAIFVLLVTSTAATMFPVLATNARRLGIPPNLYLVARHFGSGVIIATAFIHLLDPAYEEIGPASCVGLTEGWEGYSWPPALAMTSAMLIFLVDFLADYYVSKRFGSQEAEEEEPFDLEGDKEPRRSIEPLLERGEESERNQAAFPNAHSLAEIPIPREQVHTAEEDLPAFYSKMAAFLILEFGVLFHSGIIGVNLGVVGKEFSTLYPVIAFHQAFEGLGIGARLSSIPFPRKYRFVPYVLALAYGLTTPIALAIGLGLRTTYDSDSFRAQAISGVLDSISSGILLYTGFVEMLARDILLNAQPWDKRRLVVAFTSLYSGILAMAILGKWA
ncbi:unnamed protein product [Clonostachys rhizophaga]|uniref:Zinc-regulated transporter 1 n=1 Tax=Clonostachys rhizophaga TaxID=160324 RepID=A0A9N9VCI9_9HYPO|nr:unnamed protein product [Clonostachys rhizophaga]